jgi:hypothetical protein
MTEANLVKTEALIKAEVDRATERYVGKAPPVVLRKLRQLSERYWRENAVAVQSIRLRVLQQQVQSGTEAIGPEGEDREAAGGQGKV